MRINLKRPNHKYLSCQLVGRHLTFPVTTTLYIPWVEFLFPSENWQVIIRRTAKLQVFVNKCLRKILRNFWPDQITNEELWKRTKQPRIDLEIRKRKWGWLDHTLRKTFDDISRQHIQWNPQAKRCRGRPRITWPRTVLEETKNVKKTCTEIKTNVKNRVRWRIVVEALCSVA